MNKKRIRFISLSFIFLLILQFFVIRFFFEPYPSLRLPSFETIQIKNKEDFIFSRNEIYVYNISGDSIYVPANELFSPLSEISSNLIIGWNLKKNGYNSKPVEDIIYHDINLGVYTFSIKKYRKNQKELKKEMDLWIINRIAQLTGEKNPVRLELKKFQCTVTHENGYKTIKKKILESEVYPL